MLPYENLPAPPATPVLALLEGVTVLDLTTSIAGPYATMLLGDIGARVIKIERPGNGDDCRAWGPPWHDGESLWLLSVNLAFQNEGSAGVSPAASGCGRGA